MKKFITAFAIAALALTVGTTAFAKEGHKGEDRGLHLGIFKNLNKLEDRNISASQFLLTGNVVSTTTNSMVVNVKSSIHVPNLTNNQATVGVDANTKITGDKNQTVTLANLVAGSQVVVVGNINGSTLTATRIHLLMVSGKAYGQVTAKTDNSIIIKNNVTGETKTFTTDGDTKVTINGETKTTADVQVGDKGFVKFKTTLSGMVAKVISLFR